jgi:hypothetical protein
MIMNFRVPGIVGRILSSCVTVGFPRMEMVQYRNYTASDGRLTHDWQLIRKDLEGVNSGLIEVLTHNFLGGNIKIRKNLSQSVRIRVEARNKDLPNRNIESYVCLPICYLPLPWVQLLSQSLRSLNIGILE